MLINTNIASASSTPGSVSTGEGVRIMLAQEQQLRTDNRYSVHWFRMVRHSNSSLGYKAKAKPITNFGIDKIHFTTRDRNYGDKHGFGEIICSILQWVPYRLSVSRASANLVL